MFLNKPLMQWQNNVVDDIVVGCLGSDLDPKKEKIVDGIY